MSTNVNVVSAGISPAFPVSAEEFLLRYMQAVTKVDIDGVQPPTLGWQAGGSVAHTFVNKWFPWIDEKLVEPKYDGVCLYLGIPSNRPTQIKDYHAIALMRAVDYILAPNYQGLILADVDTVAPESPPFGAS